MVSQRTNKKPLLTGGFLPTIERYWLVVLGLIIGYPIIMRYMKDASTKSYINNQEESEKIIAAQNNNPAQQLENLNAVTTNYFYQNIARNVAKDLGTNIATKESTFLDFKWLNPSTWTENDTEIYNSLKQLVNSGQVKTVSNCYYVLTRRNLYDDVKQYLDKDLLNKLPLFK